MFDRLGPMEILLILLVILLLFGGSRLPQLARGLGQSVREFRSALKEDSPDAGRQADPKKPDPQQKDS